MQGLLIGIDRFSTVIGKVFAWSIVLLTLQITYEVTARYLFARPTNWGYDASYMLYGILFMMAGAYGLARNGHVRGDFIYRKWPVRWQAGVELVLYFVFFFPGIIAMVFAGFSFFQDSFRQNEHSPFAPDGLVIWPFKALIPIAGAMLVLQGLAEVGRCIGALQTGAWPGRLSDVEELEVVILERAAAERGEAAPVMPTGPRP
ncbi:TRAP transporter small permease subunit [Plastoroseomonas arctica]|uniref:TRAP transporter small permease protein n=1 Tax=Plastoroseomonas arctica TaxID=1509237 RepID=A0AAF1K3Y1_9PROT|nr:TRAP transporter small permease subunit [Plastoroseomonas arctica]MBR0656268.1 TRAP transporter small permease subunit [Plastoroseomonas arctica]